ncbi:hypothetical protein M885DRAFT_524688 [Pelagophyceae sp. CCMP2097]|nr:hypothetical protein M885DRAFT_524688 [Pelagophyceae sp. CCMP2097]
MLFRWLLLASAAALSPRRTAPRRSTLSMISERQIPAYKETMKTFAVPPTITAQPKAAAVAPALAQVAAEWDSNAGHLIAHSATPLFTRAETAAIVDECEERATLMGGWTTARHGNYPTTDVPLIELPQTLKWFKEQALPNAIYPFLAENFQFALPNPTAVRVVDAFVVKYNATAGQSFLKPHRDGSVLSFNIALNDVGDYDGGGTWFEGLGSAVRSDNGHVLAHASGLLHGGHPITGGVRYILVAFCIVRDYPNFAYRFYEHVRDR